MRIAFSTNHEERDIQDCTDEQQQLSCSHIQASKSGDHILPSLVTRIPFTKHFCSNISTRYLNLHLIIPCGSPQEPLPGNSPAVTLLTRAFWEQAPAQISCDRCFLLIQQEKGSQCGQCHQASTPAFFTQSSAAV